MNEQQDILLVFQRGSPRTFFCCKRLQYNGMIEKRISSVLERASPILQKLQDDFFIIGASALTLAGIEIGNTGDIDILSSKRDALYLQQIWTDKRVNDHITECDDLFRSTFARYSFGDMDIEVMGDLEINKNNIWQPLKIQDYFLIDIKYIQLKIPTIGEQIRILELFGREKDREKIALITDSET